jgi:hypothetical protein
MQRRNGTAVGLLVPICMLLVFVAACKDAKQSASQRNDGNAAHSELRSRYSFETHLLRGTHAFNVFTEGLGSVRAMTVVHTENGQSDTLKEEIDGTVVNAACADLDRDSIPEIYVFAQSAGSGSYANLYGFQFDERGTQPIVLPELDKRHAAGYLGHDTLWTQDTVLVRRFPVYTEGDLNTLASGGTRTFEYVLQRDRTGALHLQCIRVSNNQ